MNRTTLALALSAFSLSLAAAESAPPPVAVLAGVEGTVMVNQGDRYVTAGSGTVLSSGDRIMVMAGSKASLVFAADHCTLALGANIVTSVPAQSTCAGGVADIRKFGPSYAQAVGSTATDATQVKDEKQDDRDHRKVWWWVGGVLVAAIIYDQVHDHHKERRASR